MRYLRGAGVLLLVALTMSCSRAVRSDWSRWSGSSLDVASVFIRFRRAQLPEQGWLVEVPAAQADGLAVYSAPYDDASFKLRAYFTVGSHQDGAIARLQTRDGHREFCLPSPDGDEQVHMVGRSADTHSYDLCAPLRVR